jgi:hypothetical protein
MFHPDRPVPISDLPRAPRGQEDRVQRHLCAELQPIGRVRPLGRDDAASVLCKYFGELERRGWHNKITSKYSAEFRAYINPSRYSRDHARFDQTPKGLVNGTASAAIQEFPGRKRFSQRHGLDALPDEGLD